MNKKFDILIEPYLKEYSDEIILLWEASVKSTHHFLTNENISFFKPLIQNVYLPQLRVYVIKNKRKNIVAFIGLSEDNIEMLFVAPSEQGKGYGSALVDFAIENSIFKVDVNEQNEVAYEFYKHKGFEFVSRDELDSTGKPYPILHLERKQILLAK